jgi:hypothetical protein
VNYEQIADRPKPLVCANCGVESPPDARGWRAYLDDDDVAVVFCPECSAREFEDWEAGR